MDNFDKIVDYCDKELRHEALINGAKWYIRARLIKFVLLLCISFILFRLVYVSMVVWSSYFIIELCVALTAFFVFVFISCILDNRRYEKFLDYNDITFDYNKKGKWYELRLFDYNLYLKKIISDKVIKKRFKAKLMDIMLVFDLHTIEVMSTSIMRKTTTMKIIPSIILFTSPFLITLILSMFDSALEISKNTLLLNMYKIAYLFLGVCFTYLLILIINVYNQMRNDKYNYTYTLLKNIKDDLMFKSE